MQRTLNYQCPMCGKDGQANYDEDYVHKVEVWKSWLHCDACSDYHARIIRLRDRVKNGVLRYQNAMLKGTPDSKLTVEVSDVLEKITRKITASTARRWGEPDDWTPEFVNQIMDNPHKSEFIVNDYVRRHALDKLRKRQQELLPPEEPPDDNDPGEAWKKE